MARSNRTETTDQTQALVEDSFIVRRSKARVQLIVNRAASLVAEFPEFGVDSIIAALSDWSASSVYRAAEQYGLTLTKANKQNKASLKGMISDRFLDTETDVDQMLRLRELLLGVRQAITEPIYQAPAEEVAEVVEADPLAE